MLIEFSVSNFRSFREKQTFSMVAAPRLKKKENLISPEVKGEKLPSLLKVAAIYGPNASGKSNLMKAMNAVVEMAKGEISAGGPLPVQPFRFDSNLRLEPSRFEFHFIAANTRYKFELDALPERITLERLHAFPKGKETLLYERKHSESSDEYIFGDLEGGQEVHNAWRKLTGPKSLFISQAVANSSEDLTQLRAPHLWLRVGVKVMQHGEMISVAEGLQRLWVAMKIPLGKQLAEYLSEVDVPIASIRVEGKVPPRLDAEGNEISLFDSKYISEIFKSKVTTTLTHETNLGSAEFDFEEESEGTKSLIGFYLPWMVMQAKASGGLAMLAVDEVDSSLHPEILASIVEKQLKSKNGSQLIFTTHDTHLMNTKLLRRDQFWLTERDMNGATSLRSIHEFEGREGEDVEKRYFEGRYRALPIIRKT